MNIDNETRMHTNITATTALNVVRMFIYVEEQEHSDNDDGDSHGGAEE